VVTSGLIWQDFFKKRTEYKIINIKNIKKEKENLTHHFSFFIIGQISSI
jgi:hypothetical protein